MTTSSLNLPGTRHFVIGLVSGGKDSCFNLMHCEANGHQVVAIANLRPEEGVDELDSHLYQSVGTSALPLIAQAMNLPLYTRAIQGKALEQGAEYGRRDRSGEGSGVEGDETEDLYKLLLDIKSAHPHATAVASGAILSNYQRLRIEHVCLRLRLVSLSYLWQQRQMPLLDKMLSSGIEAVLVKVAGVGLGPSLVGKRLETLRPLLERLEHQYGSHPAGEGGEYETLTVSSPLFSHRLVLLQTRVIVTDPEPFPVAFMRVERAELEEKVGWVRPDTRQLREILGLDDLVDGLDEESSDLLSNFDDQEQRGTHNRSELVQNLEIPVDLPEVMNSRFFQRDRWFCAAAAGQPEGNESAADELRQCLDSISATLADNGLSMHLHATHITLVISSMSLFASVNAVYSAYFGTSPPSRATIALPLPSSQRIKIEVIGFDSRNPLLDGHDDVGRRQALHVQSLSYWAPANIGPYSQVLKVNSRLHLAGQIPLVPSTLTLPPYPSLPLSPYAKQAVLALQHVRRLLEVMRSSNTTGGGWEGWGESCVAWWARPKEHSEESGATVREAWRLWAEEHTWQNVPIVFVLAKELPKGALVEYQANAHTGQPDKSLEELVESDKNTPQAASPSELDDDDTNDLRPDYSTESFGSHIWCETAVTSGRTGRGSRGIVFVKDLDKSDALSSVLAMLKTVQRAVAIKVYCAPGANLQICIAALAQVWDRTADQPCISVLPVLAIHDRRGVSASLAIDSFGI